MSTALLYHSFGIAGFQQTYMRVEDGALIIGARLSSSTQWVCANCGYHEVVRRGTKRRRFRAVPIGRKPVWIEVDVQRVECRRCKKVRVANIGFAHPRVRFTKAFARYALMLSQITTIQDAADHLGVSWDTVKDIQKDSLRKRFGHPKLKKLKWIAIDEMSIGHGHRYVTGVLDLKSGAVVYVGKGKDKGALEPFWKRLKASRAKVVAVAIDMSKAYYSAVCEHLPQAQVVFDHFHIIKLMNEKLTVLRRELFHEATSKWQQKLLKGSRWLLLKDPDDLDKDKNEPARLERAIKLNKPLATAYYLKEDLRRLWRHRTKATAARCLDRWCLRAEASGIPVLIKFAHLLRGYRSAILAWYDYPITTAPLEGTNNKIKTMQRMAYGYRDEEFFLLKIYAIHESKYALVG